jgi:thymidylate kinase
VDERIAKAGAPNSKLVGRGPKRATGGPLLISFSGLDGAGKSTQIANLQEFLQKRGLRTKLLAFWDNVVVLSRYREGFVHKVYGSERGIGAPGQPVNRQDKNVRKWYLTIVRHGLYLLDAIHLTIVISAARRNSGVDVIIMDRYIYDELANLPLTKGATALFVRGVNAFVPKPDVAYLLDADPEEACQRKPEYPLAFMYSCRRAYHRLARMLGYMTIIPPLPLTDAIREVENALAAALAAEQRVIEPNLNTAEAA